MIVEGKLWVVEVDAQTLGIPGAMQVFRIDRKVETMRRGKVTKTTTETAYGVTSRLPDEASPEQLLEWVREYWWIEDKQHLPPGSHSAGRSLPGSQYGGGAKPVDPQIRSDLPL